MKERSIIGKFLTANIQGKGFDDKVRKAVIVNLFALVGFSFLLFFFVNGLISGRETTYLIFISIVAILTLSSMIIVQITKNILLGGIAITTLMLFLVIGLLTVLSESTTGLFWCYTFPPIALFILGRKTGLVYTSILFAIAILVIKINIEGIIKYPAELHSRFIATFIVVGLLSYIFENIREKTFNAFTEADKEKSEYLEETLQQKEEIQTQAELLSQKNVELFQLSLVASETDNAIIIADKEGKIEWVNRAFVQLYGFEAKEYTKRCGTIFECSQKKEKLAEMLEKRKPVKYNNYAYDKMGNKIWVQTTTTPIYNDKKELNKIIIVESDITLLKMAEQEVLEKNEELNQQKDELLSKNEIISLKNEAINQSINYALTIQKSILPNLDNFNKNFDNFILFKPKDIVSGDFYWLAKTKTSCFVAAVDCTGHGVPGAFMSILGSRILDEIVLMENIYSPAEILKKLDKAIVKSLNQETTDNTDGMDLILCKITELEEDKKEIVFCGAKRPLIYYNSADKQIKTEKGVRKNIGGHKSKRNNEEFTDKIITLQKESVLYLTSDGFIDQHNNDRKKIGSKQLFDILEKNVEMPLNEQKHILNEYLENWKQNQIQTDDITIWGIKL